jgi:ectoine hydroxylase-related dioxygenase (phytanoyl-CoA dioxygenase family)
VIVRNAVTPATCSTWLAVIDAAYRDSEATASPDFVPESSSFRLRALAELPVVDVWSSLRSDVRQQCAHLSASHVAIDADQCWVRRQYPLDCAPPCHHPHSWHQDGALAFEFPPSGTPAIRDDALLRVVTCWIALTPCGIDAPGLELVTDRVDHILEPAQLTEDAVEPRWPSGRRVRPALHAGDALVFGGEVLHRTHVSASMTQTRTSIELRCFRADAIPQRLAGDKFVSVPTRD